MVQRIREINIVIAYKVPGFVQVDRLRVLRCMVNCPIDGNHCIFSRLKRESLAGTAKLPDALNDGSKIPEDGCSGYFILRYPDIGSLGIVRIKRSET